MQEIVLDDGFRSLLPPLDERAYRDLENAILKYGVRVPLVLWNNILIDGYNRYKICLEHDIPFETISMEFDSRAEVEIWMVENVIAQRQLTPIQLSYFRGVHYNANKLLHGGDRRTEENFSSYQNDNLKSGRTSKQLADHYSISQITIIRDSKLANSLSRIGEISMEAKQKVLFEDVPMNKSKLEALSDAPIEEIEVVVTEIEDGTYNRRAISTANREELNEIIDSFPEVQKLNTIINNYAKNFNAVIRNMNVTGSKELQSTLRTYINELEELYKSLKK